MLTEMVEEGELPPLEERLPVEEDRLVVDVPEYGVYGGTYQGAVLGQGDEPWLDRIVAFEPALRPDLDLVEWGLPGAVKAVEADEEGIEYTIRMREGMRWSDGEPVTADDVMFAIEDVYFNSDLYTVPPEILAVDGDPCTAERVDDFTVRLTFPGPKGNFIELASREMGSGGNLLHFPKHYFEQFLPHLDDEAESTADEAGFSDWTSYWEDRLETFNNPDRPVLSAWILTNPLNEGNMTVFERNPYYWKVDDDGAQLPFIDKLEFEVVEEEEVMLLKTINGEIDFQERHINNDQNRPVLAEGREEGNYEIFPVEPTAMNRVVISLNLNHQDEELREIFQNKDFRIGLSHAIDRQEIIDTVYQRQGEPWQAAPRPDSEYFDEEFAKQYTEFDLDLANQHLDEVGLTETDGDGFRLLPSGDRLRFTIDVANLEPHWPSAMELVVGYWQEAGVDARVNTIERTLFYDRMAPSANEHDANIWHGEGGLRNERIDPRWYVPTHDASNFATRWANWYSTRGESEFAEEPPEEVQTQMELMRQIPLEPDEGEQHRLFHEVMEIAKEQFYVIGIALTTEQFGVVKNDLRNVAETYTNIPQYASPGYTNPSAWFFDR